MGIFVFSDHLVIYTMQESSYLGKNALVSIWFRMVLTQIITRINIDSLTLNYPSDTNI